jgi:hypothetical protein
MTASVPVLLITGPVGVGKSTIAAQAGWLLREADVPHAVVDLPWIGQCWPVPAGDPWNERLSHRNLASELVSGRGHRHRAGAGAGRGRRPCGGQSEPAGGRRRGGRTAPGRMAELVTR